MLMKLTADHKILGIAGQINSFRGPHLAFGPYVVHPCSWLSRMFNLVWYDCNSHAYIRKLLIYLQFLITELQKQAKNHRCQLVRFFK